MTEETNPVIAALDEGFPNWDPFDALLTLDSRWVMQFNAADVLAARNIIEDRIESKR